MSPRPEGPTYMPPPSPEAGPMPARLQRVLARMALHREELDAERDRRIAEGRVEPDGVRRAEEEGGEGA